MTDDDLADHRAEAEACDELLRRRGLDVWIGAEPTFTRRESTAPAWRDQAEGDDKLARARALVAALGRRTPGATLHRVVGRHFPGEAAPRFAWGARWPRDARAPEGAGAGAAPEPPPLDAEPQPAPPLGRADGDAWLTVTPDPGVVEVNLAPSPTLADFLDQAARVWAAAGDAGLAAYRFHYNGDLTDSGGGGQLTFGGPSAEASPFFRYPDLLPAFVRYLANHPSLSYWFAGACVGSASQAPRPDEGARERWDELELALAWLEHEADRGALDRGRLWQGLAPLLVDASGNSHRAELNVEKLWNADFGARGLLGVVELRALRMPAHPTELVAAAALFRAVLARCAVGGYRAPLVDWGDALHDRWALPHFLDHDLRRVLGDLDDHGLGLPPRLRRSLAAWRPVDAIAMLPGALLELRRAVEFWPLVGDTASQERRGARVVDASTERWELCASGAACDWLIVDGKRVDLRGGESAPGEGAPLVIALRRRAFAPSPGFHPGLPIADPIVIEWGTAGAHQRLALHAWRPGGGPYDGLPVDAGDAEARRSARIVVEGRPGPLPRPRAAHPRAGEYTIDLRRAFVDAAAPTPDAAPAAPGGTSP